MRIAILGPAWPYRGGIAAFNERLARQYQTEGHEVEIITFTLQYPSFLFPGKTQFSEEPAPEGLEISRRINSVNPFSWLRVGRYLRRRRPDLIVTPFWLPFMAPCFGTILSRAKRKGCRRVAILHNLIPHEHRIGDRQFASYFIRSNDAFITLSRSVLEDIDQFDPKRERPRVYSPHPIYDHYGQTLTTGEARKAIGLREEGRYVLFFGFIREYKGLDLLLSAMADERLEQLGVKLIVAGEFYGDPKPYMEQLRSLDLGSRVVMHTEFIPDHEVNRYFCAADIVAQPYKSATQSGVSQIAYNFEKPMLVTNVGGLPEIVPDGKAGFVVAPDAQQIADALVRFYKEDWNDRLTEGVRDEKKRYLWDSFTAAIAGLLK
ncbi:MAG: glycosyltransferase family 4 protein [Bacteroidales bacterium]|nr:glycosyltransferase family 4 protein [Bacteroidales bacterium]